MRVALMVVGLALAVAGGCATEKERVTKEERFSAARLQGRFDEQDPIVQTLSPGERQALREAGMMREDRSGDELASEDGVEGDAATDDGEDETTSQKFGGTMMSVLTVGITLGMMAAPYLLF